MMEIRSVPLQSVQGGGVRARLGAGINFLENKTWMGGVFWNKEEYPQKKGKPAIPHDMTISLHVSSSFSG